MAHAKAIFFGEHSVVYGYKAISIPLLELNINVSLTQSSTIQKRDEIIDYIANVCDIPNTTKINIDSNIPLGRGLGSSAALSVAIAKSCNKKNIRQIAEQCEQFIHGNPSGIDLNQVLSDKPLLFSKKDGAKYLDFKLDAYLLVIDTGVVGITKHAVKRVKDNYEKNKLYIEELGQITELVLPHLKHKEIKAVAKLMDKAHFLLQKIGVSHQTNDEIIDICKKNGALGAKLTGGGDGGCCIALCAHIENAKNLQKTLKEKEFLSWIVSV